MLLIRRPEGRFSYIETKKSMISCMYLGLTVLLCVCDAM